ncbi:MAG TPA: O-antigen ligase family protein [Solirubrobacteraceae bacterium]
MLARARADLAGERALLLGLAVALGLAAGIRPSLGLGAALGIAFCLATLTDVTVGLVLFTVLSFLDVVNGGGGVASVTKAAGALLFGSWYIQRLVGTARTTGSAARLDPQLTIAIVSLALWSALSVTWAESSSRAMTSTVSFVLDMLLFPVVLVAVRRRDHLLAIMGAFVVGAVISTAYGFIHPAALGSRNYGRLTGGLGDANEQAAVLVAAIPLAVGIAATATRQWVRNAAWASAVFCAAGVLHTLSRGGLVALGAVLLAAVVFGGRWRPKAIVLLAVVALGTVTYYGAIAPLAARERVTMTSTSGRSDIWRVAWRTIKAHPVGGVGAGNFQIAAVHHVQGVGALTSAYLIVDVPHVAHNVYLELLADLGIPGALAFIGVAVFSLLAAGRAARAFERQGDAQLEIASRCLVLSLVAFLVADLFLSGEFSKQLWLIFALCSAALALSRKGTSMVSSG